jgi:GAF domain-containing protein/DNA-binding NarL/FixJ family response regulator
MSDLNGTIRIMLIDDEPTQTEDLQKALEEYPDTKIQVTVFQNGEDAILAVAREPFQFDVALVDMDLNHPQLNGIEVMHALYEYNLWLPVIIFTGQDPDVSTLEAAAEGAYLYLRIPKGAARPRDIVAHCLQAVKDRALRRSAEVEKVSHALLSTRDLDEVLDTYEAELKRLGYGNGALYLCTAGWLVGEEVEPGIRNAVTHDFLYRARDFGAFQLHTFYDLDEPTQMKWALAQDQEVVSLRDPEVGDKIYLVIPLRDKVTNDRKLGAVILGPRPDKPSKEEESALEKLGHQMAIAVRNALDFQLQRRRNKVWEAILELNKEIGKLLEQRPSTSESTLNTYSISAVTDEVAKSISEALGFRRVLVSDVSHRRARLSGIFGLAQDEAQSIRGTRTLLSKLQKLDQEIYRHGSSYFIPEGCFELEETDIHKIDPDLPRSDPSPWCWQPHDQLRTRVKNRRDEVIAYIALDEMEGARPDDSTFEALEIFSSRLADLLENLRVLRHQEEMEVIKNLGDQLNSVRSNKELSEIVDKELSRIMHTARIKVGIYDEKAQLTRFEHQRGETHEQAELPLGKGLTSWIIDNSRPPNSAALLLSTREEVKAFHDNHELKMLGDEACSWMGVPLQAEGQVLGVVALEHESEEYAYDEHDLDVLKIVSTSMSNAVVRIALEGGTIDALRAVSDQLVGAVVSSQQVEKLILESAARLTDADYSVFLHYDAENNSLVARAEDWYVRNARVGPPPVSNIYLPLKPPKGQPTSLTVKAVDERDVLKWDEVQSDPNYKTTLPDIHSLIAMPVFVPSPTNNESILYGVWTMEAQRSRAFTDSHVNMLRVFTNFAVQAVQRAQKQQEIQSLVAWTLLRRNTTFVQHLMPNVINGVGISLDDVKRRLHTLREEVRQLYDAARFHEDPSVYALEVLERVHVNRLVRDALETLRFRARTQTIRIQDPDCFLSDRVTVPGNHDGLQEVLLEILENAYSKLLETPGSHYIKVTTLQARDGGTVIWISNSGPPLREDVAAFIEGPGDWDSRYAGLSKIRLLLSLYKASLRIQSNNAQGVALELYWPPNARRPAHLAIPTPVQRKRLGRIRQRMAERSWHQLIPKVVRQCSDWQDRQDRLTSQIETVRQDITYLDTVTRANLDVCERVHVNEFLQEFVQDMERWQAGKGIAIIYNPLAVKDLESVEVDVNRAALTMVLHDLVSNAVSAIRTEIERDGAAKVPHPVISIEPEAQQAEFVIRIRNTGSIVSPTVWDRLTKRQNIPPEISGKPPGHGLGIFLGHELMGKCGGSLSPTENDPNAGVVFTIRLRIVAPKRNGEDHANH